MEEVGRGYLDATNKKGAKLFDVSLRYLWACKQGKKLKIDYLQKKNKNNKLQAKIETWRKLIPSTLGTKI